MFNSLMRLLDDSSLWDYRNRIMRNMDNIFSDYGHKFSAFKDLDDHYELSIAVAKDAKASNVKVDFDDETGMLSVSYYYQKDGFKSSSMVEQTLPDDADAETIDAKLSNGELLITAKKVVKQAEEKADDNSIKVNRTKK